jgi:hypothetical protein
MLEMRSVSVIAERRQQRYVGFGNRFAHTEVLFLWIFSSYNRKNNDSKTILFTATSNVKVI